MSEKDFLHKINEQLDKKAEHLDAATLSKLNQARQRALENIGHSTQGIFSDIITGSRLRWLPASAMAGLAIVAFGSFLFLQNIDNSIDDRSVDTLEIVASSNNLDMYEQLDFYMWLLEEGESAG